HDILPGTSIGVVYEEAAADFARVRAALEPVVRDAATSLAGREQGFESGRSRADGPAVVALDTSGCARDEVVTTENGRPAIVVCPPFGAGVLDVAPALAAGEGVRAARDGAVVVLENAHLRAAIDGGGAIVSLVEKATGREALDGPANVLEV